MVGSVTIANVSLSVIPRIRVALVAGAAALSLLLAGCSSGEPGPSEEEVQSSVDPEEATSDSAAPEETASAPEPEVEPQNDLSAIEVTDEDVPVVSVETPWYIDATRSEVLRESDNPQVVGLDSIVTVNYVGVNGRSGAIFDSSFERGSPATFTLQQLIPGFQKGMVDRHVGSRVLIGIPSEDGYPSGSGALIDPGDSLIFVVDILAANFDEALGEEVAPAEGLPVVEMADDGPTVTIPDAEPPAELQVQPLIRGTGPEIQPTDMIQVKFRTWNWDSGELIEDGWHPQQGPLDHLIEGWKQGLAGQTTGSRMLLVVPPELAYPNGNETAPTVEPGQTLVYVIDLLYAAQV